MARSHRKRGVYRIQIINDMTLEYFRNIILGVRQYGFDSGRMVLGDRWLAMGEEELEVMIKRDRIDGIIAQVNDRKLEEKLLNLPIPVVNISNLLPDMRLPLVTQNDFEVGALAADHLIECGCASFGAWGQKQALFSSERIRGFEERLRVRLPHVQCFVGEGTLIPGEKETVIARKVEKWLKKLPRPLGVFAVLDTLGLHLLRAAQRLGLRVPEDIAILGAGDDEFWVAFESIPLSSIKLPSRQLGYEAAALLDEMISNRGKKVKDRHLSVTEIAQRRSTDVLFVEDQAVAKAVAYIREHADTNIYIDDVVRSSGVSRSGLKERFRRSLGRSILDEIRQVRITRVQSLLRSTDLKLTAIAEMCDFPSSPRLNVLFKECTGMTPGQYRAMFKKE